MTNDMPIELYPTYVRESRYNGVYEGGQWIAWSGYSDLPDDATGGDLECQSFFMEPRSARIGRGRTPDQAVNDLIERWDVAGRPTDFSLNGDYTPHPDFNVMLADAIRGGALAEYLADVPPEALGFEPFWRPMLGVDEHLYRRRCGGDTA